MSVVVASSVPDAVVTVDGVCVNTEETDAHSDTAAVTDTLTSGDADIVNGADGERLIFGDDDVEIDAPCDGLPSGDDDVDADASSETLGTSVIEITPEPDGT